VWGLGTLASNFQGPRNGVPLLFPLTLTTGKTSNLRRLRIGEEKKKERRKKDRNHRAKYNGLTYSIG